MKLKLLKKTSACMLACILTVVPLKLEAFGASATSENLLYESKEKQIITSGVTYEKSSRLYKDGWMDVYVLTVDTNNTNVALDVIHSATEFGLKKSVEALSKENNVVAAVNGDFFGSGNPQSSMGQVFSDGKIEQAQNYYNSTNNYAGFFVDKWGAAFIDYVKTQFNLYNAASPGIEIAAKNKYNGFKKPIYIDRQAMTDTSNIDKRISGLVKVVVENGAITKISAPGEAVTVPESGYIIVMRKEYADSKLIGFAVGQRVTFSESGAFVFRPAKNVSEISVGISGGGEILRGGNIVSNGLIIGQNARNPRTVIGVNKEKNKVIIMAVDGRKNGIGATHNEVARLLLEYGAYDAMHLDGGGSTTMAVKQEGDEQISIVNVPSEGSQRAVANALGIKTLNEPTGIAKTLEVYSAEDTENTFMDGVSSPLAIKGYDEYHNAAPADISKVEFKVTGGNGTIEGNMLTPSGTGDIQVTAYMDGEAAGVMAGKVITAPVKLSLSAEKGSLDIGESTGLSAALVNKDSFKKGVGYNDVTWIVDKPEVGFVENGRFTATGEGLVTLMAKHGDYVSTIELSVGKKTQYIEGFEKDRLIKFITYPPETGISGGCGKTNGNKYQGEYSYVINYKFVPNSTTTQAAYMSFESEPISLEDATNVNMWVKGDGNGCLLKGVVKDKNNKEYFITFSENIDYNDWKYVSAAIPKEAEKPLKLDKVYVAALQTTSEVAGSIYIDELSTLVPLHKTVYSDDAFSDYLDVELDGAPGEGEHDITIFGQTARRYGDNMTSVMSDVMKNMEQNSRAMYFVGETDITTTSGIPTIRWDNKYFTTNTEYVSIISLATKNGCIRTENYDQWRWFKSYLYNHSRNNVIIGMDKDIWGKNGANLTDIRERELFHKILKEFVRETGKNVIVVAATGYNTDVTVKDGIRYITLNGASAQNSYDTSKYKYLRVRATANDFKYDIKNIY